MKELLKPLYIFLFLIQSFAIGLSVYRICDNDRQILFIVLICLILPSVIVSFVKIYKAVREDIREDRENEMARKEFENQIAEDFNKLIVSLTKKENETK